MKDFERLQKAVKWLISEGYGNTQTDISNKTGYTRPMFNNLYNGRNRITDRVWVGLYDIDNRLSLEWLRHGIGGMFEKIPSIKLSTRNVEEVAEYDDTKVKVYVSETTTLKELYEALKKKDEQLAKKDEQITELIVLLKNTQK